MAVPWVSQQPIGLGQGLVALRLEGRDAGVRVVDRVLEEGAPAHTSNNSAQCVTLVIQEEQVEEPL